MRLVPYLRAEHPGREPRTHSERSRLSHDFFNDWPLSTLLQNRENWIPPVDVLEKDGDMILRCELPGIQEKDIDVRLEGNLLTLRGEKRFEGEEEKDSFHRIERFTGTFSRSFTLPDTVDVDKIRADYKNGILTIRVPQRPEVRPREIPVHV